MERHHVTQAQMARQTGTSQKHINQILQGNAMPSPHLVVKMARVLNEDGDFRQRAAFFFHIQARHLIQKALRELDDWVPLPDLPHRRPAAHDEEDQPHR